MSIDVPQRSERLESPNRRNFLGSLFKFAAVSAALRAGIVIPETKAGETVDFIRKKYGIEVFFTEIDEIVVSGDSREAMPKDTPAARERRLFAEDMIAKFLDKYPPKTLRNFVKRIQITAKIVRSENSTKCTYKMDVGGIAHNDTQTVELSHNDSNLTEYIFDHEIVHLVLHDVSYSEWLAAIRQELGTYADAVPPLEGIQDRGDSAEDFLCQYDPKNWMDKGYASVNFAEDIARVSETVFHPTRREPPKNVDHRVFDAKARAFKRLFAQRLQLPYDLRNPTHPNNYWEFLKTLPQEISMEYFFKNRLLYR